MRASGVSRALIAAAATAALAIPASAPAAVTFGSDLSTAPNSMLSNLRTLALRAAGTGNEAEGGATAPTEGVITAWRVRKGPTIDAHLSLRVIRENTSLHEGDPEPLPDAAGVYEFDARAPVAAGDAIGVDQVSGDDAIGIGAGAAGSATDAWYPPLGPAETRAVHEPLPGLELLISAELEPDCDGDGLGDETQDSNLLVCTPDLDPPQATIDKGVAKRIEKRAVKFKFSADEPGSTFECRLKGRGLDPLVREFGTCTSPRRYKRLARGKHRFQVRAIDEFGNVGAPDKDRFRVVG